VACLNCKIVWRRHKDISNYVIGNSTDRGIIRLVVKCAHMFGVAKLQRSGMAVIGCTISFGPDVMKVGPEMVSLYFNYDYNNH
jgi:hypothetical protein